MEAERRAGQYQESHKNTTARYQVPPQSTGAVVRRIIQLCKCGGPNLGKQTPEVMSGPVPRSWAPELFGAHQLNESHHHRDKARLNKTMGKSGQTVSWRSTCADDKLLLALL